MNYAAGSEKLQAYRRQIAEVREKMRATQAEIEPQEVADYEFQTPEGPVRLAQLFGKHRDLMVVHNMGRSCPYCTLWADGYNGIHEHVSNRTAFVVSSPDSPAVQQKFAAGRGWKFPMVSHAGNSFAADMGYRSEKGRWLPGISVFARTGAKIVRVSDAAWSPGDDFCTLWHFFDLLPGGAADWKPQFSYS
ncbi:MAG TPA: DUF899 family protein [Steroidobacteraceae bacterium]|nr:DUF899 family protein [Steroidobacteraceae bacterium]